MLKKTRRGLALLAACLLLLQTAAGLAAEEGFANRFITAGQGTAGVPFQAVAPGTLAQPRRRVTAVSAVPAAFEMKAPSSVTPFGENTVTVSLPAAGLVTVEARSLVSTVIPENALTEYRAEAGTFSFSWPALSWNDEPLTRGDATLTCRYTPEGGEEQTLKARVTVEKPLAALLYALPETDYWNPDTGFLRVDLELLAGGIAVAEIYRNDLDQVLVFRQEIRCDGGINTVWKWNGSSNRGQRILPGEYIMRFYSTALPERTVEQPLYILAGADEPELSLSAAYNYPAEGGDEAVWAFLTSPVWVAVGYEGNGLRVRIQPSENAKTLGFVTCATVGVAVMDLSVPGWARIGAYRNEDGAYVEGWVRRDQLRYQPVSTKMAIVVDKASQRLTVWQDGHPIGTAYVSTGSTLVAGKASAETRAGVFLTGTRMTSFVNTGYRFLNVFRIDGNNLIHSIGFNTEDGYTMSFRDHTNALGQKASHGCIRVDVQASDENNGITSWWIWAHAQRNTKIFIIEGGETEY